MRNLYQFAAFAVLLLGLGHAALAQGLITGKVSDGSSGLPLSGAAVIIKGSTLGVYTDDEGQFELNLPAGQDVMLIVSYYGYTTDEVKAKPGTNLNITLNQDVANLDEVVVTGLASNIKRSNLANAVSTVSAAQLTGMTTQQTLDGALYGKLPGVNIVQTSGAPGGGFAVRLRGVSSLTGNNQPLYIIDGVYISNAEIPNGSRFASGANAGNEEGAANRIADINPQDIENIEVLKGASAAAIYGTRANAGVVIITTKRGKAGETKINFDQDLGFNNIIRFVGRRQFTPETVEQAFGAAERQKFETAQALGQIYDYEREIYGEKGFITDSRLSMSGGSEKTQFFFSLGNRDEDGIVKNTGFKRRTVRLNIEHRISNSIRFSSYTNYINSWSNRGFTGNENEGGLSYGYNLAFTRDWANLFPDENGVYPFNPNAAGNPLFVRDQTRNEDQTNRLIQGGRLTIDLLKRDNMALRLVGNGGIDFFLNETEVYVPESHQGQVGRDNGFFGVGKNKFFNLNYQAFAIMENHVNSKLHFTTQAGVSYLNFDRDLVYSQTTQLIPLQSNLSQGGSQSIAQTFANEEEFGLIAQEEVNFDDKFIGTVGFRADKSSLNGDPNKYYFFPRASGAVNIANFDFWSIEAINQLKLRAAFGTTGNSAAFGSLFTALTPNNIGGQAGFIGSTLQGNASLRPETSREIEFGMDVAMFKGRLSLEATYYLRNVDSLLFTRALPTSSGFSNEVINDLNLQNRGVELSLNAVPVSKANFRWNTTLNWWFNRSKVTFLGVPAFVPAGTAFGLGLGTFYIEEGEPITQIKGRIAGQIITVGDVEPTFQMGWVNSVTLFKKLDINLLTHWKQGGDVLNLSRLLTDLGRITPDLDDPIIRDNPRPVNAQSYTEDATYFRIREISAYYTISGLELFDGAVKGIRIGLSARNPLTLTNYSSYDPETSTKGGSGLSNSVEVTPFPSMRQYYFHAGFRF